MEQLRIAVIGAGGMGTSHARAIQTLPNARLVAVSDTDEERGRKLSEDMEVPWYADYVAMARSDDVHAVSIASPPFLHKDMAVTVAEIGKHVFCEKPMAVHVADCEAIIAAAERAGVTLMVGQVLRFLSPFIKVLELVDSGAIGTPISALVTRLSGRRGGGMSAHWRGSLESSGGILMEINAHEIDLLRCLCGDVASVYAEGGNYLHPQADYPDLAFVSLRFRSGAIGSLYTSSASALGGTSGLIQGSDGAIRYQGWGKQGSIEWKRFDDAQPTVINLADLDYQPGVTHEFQRFAEAALTHTPPVVPGLDGLKVVEIARAAYDSAASGRRIELPQR
jgi:predicted dehydrogenase